jgi:type IV secretory pathway VirB10-like protein
MAVHHTSAGHDVLGLLAYLAGMGTLLAALYIGFQVAIAPGTPERSTTAQAPVEQRAPLKVERRTAEEKELPVPRKPVTPAAAPPSAPTMVAPVAPAAAAAAPAAPDPSVATMASPAAASPHHPAHAASASYPRKKALEELARQRRHADQRRRDLNQGYAARRPVEASANPNSRSLYAPTPSYGPANIDGRY